MFLDKTLNLYKKEQSYKIIAVLIQVKMSNQIKNYGEEDQELLLGTFALYYSRITQTDILEAGKIVRQSMFRVTSQENVTFKDTRFLDVRERKELVKEGINEFIAIAHVTSDIADKIREECLIIYEHWKRYKRRSPTNDEIELHNFLQDLKTSGIRVYK